MVRGVARPVGPEACGHRACASGLLADPPPAFPVSGDDLLARGVRRGPALSQAFAASGFRLGGDELPRLGVSPNTTLVGIGWMLLRSTGKIRPWR